MTTEQFPKNQQCEHPADWVQSGCHVPGTGVYLLPVCMKCGAELTATAEVLMTQEREDG